MITAVVFAVAASGCSIGTGKLEVELLVREGIIRGPVVALVPGADGVLWALTGDRELVRIDGNGAVEARRLELPDGVDSFDDLAVAPDRTAYLICDDLPEDGSSVYRVDGSSVVPAFGIPSGDTTSAPDGSPAARAALGAISDIAVDDAGRVLFVESHSPDGGVLSAAMRVRRVEADGTLITLAGTVSSGNTEDFGWFPPDGTKATSHRLAWPIAIVTAPGADVYIRTGQSVLRVADGSLTRLFGGSGGGLIRQPNPRQTAPFADAHEALAARYENIAQRATFAVSSTGGVLVGAPVEPQRLSSEVREAFSWDFGSDAGAAQQAADAVFDRKSEASKHSVATVHVGPDGMASTASFIGSLSTWLDQDTIVTVLQINRASRETIFVSYDVPSRR